MTRTAWLVVFSTGECEDVAETVLGVFLDETSAERYAAQAHDELVALSWDGGSPKTLERREWRGLSVDYTGADIEVRTAPLSPEVPS